MPPTSLPTTTSVARRCLYVYENYGATIVAGHFAAPEDVRRRTLYTYVNEGVHGLEGQRVFNQNDVLRRVLYVYVNIGHDRDPTDTAARALYGYAAYTNDEPFPWIEKIVPNEQYPLGQVDIHGDGFGDTQGTEGGLVKLGTDLMGVVSWSARSPNLWPANSETQTAAAITVTVPIDGESNLVTVELTI